MGNACLQQNSYMGSHRAYDTLYGGPRGPSQQSVSASAQFPSVNSPSNPASTGEYDCTHPIGAFPLSRSRFAFFCPNPTHSVRKSFVDGEVKDDFCAFQESSRLVSRCPSKFPEIQMTSQRLVTGRESSEL